MASVLFSTIGQAVGGPLGAAVGAAVGGTVDSVLFGARRRGATDLFVQRSAYGDVLPRLYGRSRAAGQLIWALPIAGARGKGSGRGNGGASFAIALSSGPVKDVRRIWADGREIRSDTGAFEVRTTMRLHRGDHQQQLDSLIAAAEGEGRSPAYSGLAYVVFEDFDLAPYGNRIPNFSFEVVADDDAPVDWLRDQASKAAIAVVGTSDHEVAQGYAAIDRGLDECGRLSRFCDLSLSFDDGRAQFSNESRLFEIGREQLLAAMGGVGPELMRDNPPAAVSLTYLDSDRDYQAGRQRAARTRRGLELECEAPIYTSAGVARSISARLLRQSEAAAERIRFGLSWRWLAVAVGDLLEIEGIGRWRVTERDVCGLLVHVVAERTADSEIRPILASDPGRGLPAPMMPAGVTELKLFEAPVSLKAGGPAAWLWMSGGPGWRGAQAALLANGDDVHIGEVRQLMPWGRLVAPVEPRPETLWDRASELIVAVEEGMPHFQSRSEMDVLGGANLLHVGDELLQYCDAEPLDGQRVRLTGLLRGRFGTGFLMRPLEAGEVVRLVAPTMLLEVDLPSGSAGRELVALANGRGDPAGGTSTSLVVDELGASTMAPVHVRAWRDPDRTLLCSWVSRSAAGWNWAASDPAFTDFVWQFRSDDGRVVSRSVNGLAFSLSLSEQIALLGEPFGSGVVVVAAMGDGPATLRTSVAAKI